MPLSETIKKGDEVIGTKEAYPNAKYPAWAMRVHDITATHVQAAPIGGGMVHNIPKAQFDEKFRLVEQDERNPPYKPALFVIEDGKSYPGFHDGSVWNGWAMPYFERHVASQILADFKTNFNFVGAEDKFKYVEQMGEGQPAPDDWNEAIGVDIEVDGQKKHLYGVGAGFWIWSVDE